MPTTQFNLADAFETVAGVNPDRECLIWGDKRFTFSQVADRSRRLGAYLRSRGLGVHTERAELAGHESGQDHLGLYLYNGNEYLEGMLGAFMSRVAPFNVNYRYVADELLYLLDNSQCRALVYHAAFAPTLAEVLRPAAPARGARPGGRRLGQRPAARRGRLRDGAGRRPSPTDRRRAPPPTTSTSSTRAARPACRRACCGASTTSSCRRMGGRNILTQETVETYDDLAAQAAAFPEPLKFLVIPPLMHGAAQWVAFIALNNGHAIVLPPDTKTLRPGRGVAHRSNASAAPPSPSSATPSPARSSRSSSRAATTRRRC